MAQLLEWSDKFSVGCELIDKQHKNLCNLINKLYDAFVQAKANNVINDILQEMADYTVYHFRTEEELFEKYDYYDKENHKNEHNHFVEKVEEFMEKLKKGEVSVSYEVMTFLKDWLTNHILKSDMMYKDFICK